MPLLSTGRFFGGVAASLSAIETIAVSSLSTTPVEIDLTGYSTVSISAFDALLSSNTTDIVAQFGYNDGVSTTWYDTSGDYVRNTEYDTVSSVSDHTSILLLNGQTAAGYGSLHYWEFTADGLALSCPKPCRGTEFLSDPGGGSTDGAMLAHVFTPVTVINRMRIFLSTGTGTSGTIYVLKENRSQVLQTIDVSTITAGGQIDLTGYSSAHLISMDYVHADSNGVIFWGVSGATVYDTNGDVSRLQEEGSGAAIQLSRDGFTADAIVNTSKKFMFSINNLDLAVPSFSYAAGMVPSDNDTKWWSIMNHAVVVDALSVRNAGTSGTLYVIGDETPNTLIATIDVGTDMSTGVDTVDVSGYSRVNISSFDAATGSGAMLVAAESSDNGSSYDETSGDYWNKREVGNDESQGASFSHFLGDAYLVRTNHRHAAEFFGVDKAVPTFSRCADFYSGHKTQAIHMSADVCNSLQLKFASSLGSSPPATAGASGTIYVTGQV